MKTEWQEVTTSDGRTFILDADGGAVMAAISLPKPGEPGASCVEPCDHADCHRTRTMANTICPLCLEPIGYDRQFYTDWIYGLVHFTCLHKLMREIREGGK